jgi:hypothetical protein
MTKARNAIALLLGIVATTSCGGSGGVSIVTTAPTPGPIAVTVVAGDTGIPLSGASISGGATTVGTSSAGQATVVALAGTSITITAEGFLLRNTLLRPGTSTLALWPKTTATGLTESATLAMVYDNQKQSMTRWNVDANVAVVPGPDIAADPEAMAALAGAAARLTEATRGHMTVRIDTGATTGPTIQAVIDPSRALFGAAAYVNTKNHGATGGVIAYKGLSAVRSVGINLHELAHFYGLVESPDTIDISGPGPGLRSDFSARELTLIDLMWLRPPGNVWPDNDQQVTSAGTSKGVSVIHCRVE